MLLGILGVKTKLVIRQEEYGEYFCNYCELETMHSLVGEQQWLAIFGISVAMIGEDGIACCSECGRVTDTENPPAPPTESDMRQCSSCGEKILAAVFVCRYCGKEFSEEEIQSSIRNSKSYSDNSDAESIIRRMQR